MERLLINPEQTAEASGQRMHDLARELFPICRSLTGAGVRETLNILKREIPSLEINEVTSGTKVLDWTVPLEWNIRDAYVLDPEGKKVIDFFESNLSVVGYSIPINTTVSLEELEQHLYSLPELPDAIPYITSYYKERWGFCISENRRKSLVPGQYRVVIDSSLKAGALTYAEVYLPGESSREVFLSTYVCHPSMGNNELSGPVVTTELYKWIAQLPCRRYSYRFVFIPETIGSITYISKNIKHLKKNVIAGFNVTCIGDDRAYSYLPSRAGDTMSDRVALHVLKHSVPEFVRYSYLDRGSDERQYCSPGVDLPIATVMRSKYGVYPEYHTSKDDLTVITPTGLYGGFNVLRKCVEAIESNEILRVTVLGEPQLGARGLYPTLSTKSSGETVRAMMDLIAYCDGTKDLIAIADTIGRPIWTLYDVIQRLKAEGLLINTNPLD